MHPFHSGTEHSMATVRTGQAPDLVPRDDFGKRFREHFLDPGFRSHDAAIAELEAIAWEAYRENRKSPITEKAGPGFADAQFELSVQWKETRDKVLAAGTR